MKRDSNKGLSGKTILLFICLGAASLAQGFAPEEVPTFKDRAGQNPEGQKLCIFMDGTMNNADDLTNVRRLFEKVSKSACPLKLCYYDIGVGADFNKASGSIGGFGFSKNIKQAYQFLGENYDPKDTIYLFGFSRGARQAQTLCDLIDQCGIPKLERESNRTGVVGSEVDQIVKVYKSRLREKDYRPLHLELGNQRANVEFVGIWDSVESLGSNVLRTMFKGELKKGPFKSHSFYTYDFPKSVNRAYHAMALDEQRGLYEVVPWDQSSSLARGQVLEQVWFAGGHGDVGGGYKESRDLPLISLEWIMSKLEEDRLFASTELRQLDWGKHVGAELSDTTQFLVGKLLVGFRQHYPRSQPFWTSRSGDWIHPKVHRSVFDRMSLPPRKGIKTRLEPIGLYRPDQFAAQENLFCDPVESKNSPPCVASPSKNFYEDVPANPRTYHLRSERLEVQWERLCEAVEQTD